MRAAKIRSWLLAQTEYDYDPNPGSIKITQDPKVPDTFAVRFDDAEMGQTDLLFVCGNEEGTPDEVLSRCLEEVEFESWPPKSGPLQFFT